MIPRIIHQVWHQIWNDKPIPQLFVNLADTWKQHHPEWEYRLWTDSESRSFIKTCFPELLSVYDSYPYGVQRVDAVRYCILQYFGGVSVDLDMECLRSIDELIEPHDMVLTLEPPVHAYENEVGFMISNAFMASRPHHPFLSEILDELMTGSKEPQPNVCSSVLETTGPLMLTEVYSKISRQDVCVMDHYITAPLACNSPEWTSGSIFSGGQCAVDYKRFYMDNGAYAIHYWANTWLNEDLPFDMPTTLQDLRSRLFGK